MSNFKIREKPSDDTDHLGSDDLAKKEQTKIPLLSIFIYMAIKLSMVASNNRLRSDCNHNNSVDGPEHRQNPNMFENEPQHLVGSSFISSASAKELDPETR